MIEEDPGSFCNFNTIPWLLLGHFDKVVLTPAAPTFWCQSHYHLETHSTTTIILPYYQNVQSIENDLLRRLLFYTATFWYRRLQSKRKYCYCRSSFALLFIIVSHQTSSPINWISYWKQITCYWGRSHDQFCREASRGECFTTAFYVRKHVRARARICHQTKIVSTAYKCWKHGSIAKASRTIISQSRAFKFYSCTTATCTRDRFMWSLARKLDRSYTLVHLHTTHIVLSYAITQKTDYYATTIINNKQSTMQFINRMYAISTGVGVFCLKLFPRKIMKSHCTQ